MTINDYEVKRFGDLPVAPEVPLGDYEAIATGDGKTEIEAMQNAVNLIREMGFENIEIIEGLDMSSETAEGLFYVSIWVNKIL